MFISADLRLITGTAEQYVVKMYEEHLGNGTEAVTPLIQDAISSLVQGPSFSVDESLMETLAHNSSATVSVVVFNPTSWTLEHFVAVASFQTNLIVRDSTGALVSYDVLPVNASASGQCQVPGTCGHPITPSPYTLFFEVRVPALGFETYFVSVNTSALPNAPAYTLSSEVTSVSNGAIELNFDPATHLLSSASYVPDGIAINISHNIYEYDGIKQFPESDNPGGCYVFAPAGGPVPIAESPYFYQVVQGRFVTEVRQKFSLPCNDTEFNTAPTQTCGVEQVYRIYASKSIVASSYVDIVSADGPLAANRELIGKFTTSLNTNGYFSTDDNCFASHQRTFNASIQPPPIISGNYYPLTCVGSIVDTSQNAQLSLLVDRSHGGSSQGNGEFEILYHRRTTTTDDKGPLLVLDVSFN